MLDTSRIHQLVDRGRRRLRLQRALEVATAALIPLAAVAMVIIFAIRQHGLPATVGFQLLGAGLAIAIAVVVVAGFRRFSDQEVATRIDRASQLADRLATACAFEKTLTTSSDLAPQTEQMMKLAIADGIASIDKADVALATPFRKPTDLKAAMAFVACAALVSVFSHPRAPLDDEGAKALRADSDKANANNVNNVNVNDLVAFEEDDFDYTNSLVDELLETANETGDEHLEQYANDIKELLSKADAGELSKQELLEKLAEAERKYNEGTDEEVDAAVKELEKTGKDLKKEPLTQELGKALELGDLEKAQKEMEKLADQLAKNKLGEKEQKKLAKALEKAAENFEKRQTKENKRQDQQQQKRREQVSKLQRQLSEAKTDREKSRISRQLEQKKRQLKKLERKNAQQQKSSSRRQLKELHRNMKQASKQMQKKSPESRKQASRRMRDMQRNTRKVSQDKRRMTNKRKMASQMRDLKDAMRRAKRKGSRGPKDRFGRNRRNRDFGRGARGGRGNRGAWKAGQSGKGRGKGGKGGKGNRPGGGKPGGDRWGTGDGGDLLGDATKATHKTQDESIQGVRGKGPSMRETILTAAEKGFSSVSYRKVHARYKTVVEEIINSEKVPAGYKYYVKKYFQKIKPQQ